MAKIYGTDDNYLDSSVIYHVNKPLNEVLDDEYQEMEVVTNKIFAGKKVYRKLLKGTLDSETVTALSFDLKLLNFDNIWVNGSNSFFVTPTNILPVGHYGGTTDWSRVFFTKSNKTLTFKVGDVYKGFNPKDIYIVIEYTKN